MPKPHSPFVEELLDLLTPLGEVRARRMFGGYGIYKDDLMFGLVAYEQFYLKVDDESRAQFEALNLEPFRYEGRDGQMTVMKYFQAPESAFASSLHMKPWALLGWQAAQRALKSPKPKRPKKKSHGRPR